MHNWDVSSSLASGLSSSSIMSALHEQQQTYKDWFNNASQQTIFKQEPIDYHTSLHNSHNGHPMLSAQTTPPQSSAMDQMLDQMPSSFRQQLGAFNPLTPPGYSGLLFPSMISQHKQLTPSKIQNLIKASDSVTSSLTPPMDVTPPKSPKDLSMSDQTPIKEELQGMGAKSDSLGSYDGHEESEFEDHEDIDTDALDHKPKNGRRKNTNGKPKQYKCKQCKYLSITKSEFWAHTRGHIKPEKMLQCPSCEFVTEYKHHLEYHLRNHTRSKPFQCPKCNYSCVNKSMLNSHLKSHSTVFQYRCADCNYATKYCHSLKLHLRKYSHKPDIVLNLDGTPNPLPIIDVYGTRRGPKTKSTTSKLLEEISRNAQKCQVSPPLTPSSTSSANMTTTLAQASHSAKLANQVTTPTSSNILPNATLMANMLKSVGNNMSLFPYLNLNFQMFAAHQQQTQQYIKDQDYDEENSEGYYNAEEQEETPEEDVSMNASPSTTPSVTKQSRRKGLAFKLDEKSLHDDDDEPSNSPQTPNSPQSPVSSLINNKISTTSSNTTFECKYCGIIFKDNVLYTIHSGYHGYNDVFQCNMCGEKCDDHVQFFLHIAKFPHS